jgi:hypothetical protein
MGRASRRKKKGGSPDLRPRLNREARDLLRRSLPVDLDEFIELDLLNPRKLYMPDGEMQALIEAQTGQRVRAASS